MISYFPAMILKSRRTQVSSSRADPPGFRLARCSALFALRKPPHRRHTLAGRRGPGQTRVPKAGAPGEVSGAGITAATAAFGGTHGRSSSTATYSASPARGRRASHPSQPQWSKGSSRPALPEQLRRFRAKAWDGIQGTRPGYTKSVFKSAARGPMPTATTRACCAGSGFCGGQHLSRALGICDGALPPAAGDPLSSPPRFLRKRSRLRPPVSWWSACAAPSSASSA
mmetsp:Transcript_70808/g.189045  ORF Transcript_70808/g.189045 Transcript_70808/m.189045 type:complete len:227 (+) Transcript_70808:406-1086(+)